MITLIVAAALGAPPKAALGTTVLLPREVVSPDEPMLIYLAMQNRTAQRIYFENHSFGACFLEKFAEVTLDPPAEKRPLPDCSFTNKSVEPEESMGMLVNLSEVFVLTAPKYTIKVAWKDGGPDIYSPLGATVGPVQVATPLLTQKVRKGEKLFLPNQNTLIFNGHEWKPGAKRTDAPQLKLNFTLIERGKGETEKSVTIAGERSHQFNLDAYRFDVGNYQFDQWMDLKMYEKLALF